MKWGPVVGAGAERGEQRGVLRAHECGRLCHPVRAVVWVGGVGRAGRRRSEPEGSWSRGGRWQRDRGLCRRLWVRLGGLGTPCPSCHVGLYGWLWRATAAPEVNLRNPAPVMLRLNVE